MVLCAGKKRGTSRQQRQHGRAQVPIQGQGHVRGTQRGLKRNRRVKSFASGSGQRAWEQHVILLSRKREKCENWKCVPHLCLSLCFI